MCGTYTISWKISIIVVLSFLLIWRSLDRKYTKKIQVTQELINSEFNKIGNGVIRYVDITYLARKKHKHLSWSFTTRTASNSWKVLTRYCFLKYLQELSISKRTEKTIRTLEMRRSYRRLRSPTDIDMNIYEVLHIFN